MLCVPRTGDGMPFLRTSALRACSAAAALLAAAMLAAAATPDDADTTSLVGQLLIAAPTMGDPRFSHAVILMVRHDQDGAFGIVINRPVGERSIAMLLEAAGDTDPDVEAACASLPAGRSSRSSALWFTAPNIAVPRRSMSTAAWR